MAAKYHNFHLIWIKIFDVHVVSHLKNEVQNLKPIGGDLADIV